MKWHSLLVIVVFLLSAGSLVVAGHQFVKGIRKGELGPLAVAALQLGLGLFLLTCGVLLLLADVVGGFTTT